MANTTTANGSEVRLIPFLFSFPFLCENLLKLSKIGKRHGRGEYRYADGTKYIGNWDNDRIHGEGSCWYPNGNRHVRKSSQ